MPWNIEAVLVFLIMMLCWLWIEHKGYAVGNSFTTSMYFPSRLVLREKQCFSLYSPHKYPILSTLFFSISICWGVS